MTLSCNSLPPLDLAFTFNSRGKPAHAEIALACPRAYVHTKRLKTLTSGETGDKSLSKRRPELSITPLEFLMDGA